MISDKRPIFYVLRLTICPVMRKLGAKVMPLHDFTTYFFEITLPQRISMLSNSHFYLRQRWNDYCLKLRTFVSKSVRSPTSIFVKLSDLFVPLLVCRSFVCTRRHRARRDTTRPDTIRHDTTRRNPIRLDTARTETT